MTFHLHSDLINSFSDSVLFLYFKNATFEWSYCIEL